MEEGDEGETNVYLERTGRCCDGRLPCDGEGDIGDSLYFANCEVVNE